MISTVLFVITALLFVAEKSINPWDHYLSFGDKFHVSIWDLGGRDSRIAFFSNGEYGPYRGSMIGFVGADGKLDPPLKRKEGFGDSWGIYYRLFEWHDASLWPDTKLWTLMGVLVVSDGRLCGHAVNWIVALDQMPIDIKRVRSTENLGRRRWWHE